MKLVHSVSAAILALFTSACGTKSPDVQYSPSETPPANAPGNGGTAASDARPDPNAKQPAPNAPLVFTAQEGWVEEPPANSMRKAQYVLPGQGGADDATAVVYHFQGGAGSVDMNIERWAGQFEQADGTPSMDHVQRMQRRVDGMLVHEVKLSGKYVAETSPGSGEHVSHEDWSLMAAVLESDHGNYFVKCVGPAATIRHWAGSIRGFVTQTKRQR